MKLFYSAILSVLLSISAPVWAANVNINTADAPTLQQSLNGIGQVRAQAIVDYREKHGPFKKVEELIEVDGIGKSTIDRNRDNISLN